MKIFAIMFKDLRLISRDRFALASLLIVPMVVILVVATATQSGDGSESILFPIVNEDQGPVASALIKVFRKHLDVREVTRASAQHLVADVNDAPAALILPAEMSKRYLTQKPSTIELLTDPAQWRELEAIKVIMLLADRETASLGDPFSQELLKVKEQSITGNRPSFSSLEQNIPGFSLMFVLLTLIFSVSLDLQEEEVWGTNRRLSIAPVSAAALLGGKLMARLVVGIAQLLVLLLFGHFIYGLTLGHSPVALSLVVTAVVFSMTCFAAIVAGFVRTREQAIPVGLSVVFVLAALGGLFCPLYDLPKWMQTVANGAVGHLAGHILRWICKKKTPTLRKQGRRLAQPSRCGSGYVPCDGHPSLHRRLPTETLQGLYRTEVAEQSGVVDSGVVPTRYGLRIVKARHPVILEIVRMHVGPAPEVFGHALDPLHSGLALVVVEATFPLLPYFALTVIADHRERSQRASIVPNPLLPNRRTRIRNRL